MLRRIFQKLLLFIEMILIHHNKIENEQNIKN